nr:hypothetical protein [Rheinheimera sp.]
ANSYHRQSSVSACSAELPTTSAKAVVNQTKISTKSELLAMFKGRDTGFFHLRHKRKYDKYEKTSNSIRQVVQFTRQKLMQI